MKKIAAFISSLLGNLNMKTKLLLSYFFLLIIPLIFLGILSYHKISGYMEENVLSSSLKSIEQSDAFIRYKIDYVNNILNVAVFNNDIQKVLSNDSPEYANDIIQQTEDRKKLETFLYSLQNPLYTSGIRLYVSEKLDFSEEGVNFFNKEKIKNAQWYNKLLSAKDSAKWFGPSYFNSDDSKYGFPIIACARRIRDANNFNNTLGVIRVDMAESVIKDILVKSSSTNTNLIYILNEEGELITSAGDLTLLGDHVFTGSLKKGLKTDNTWDTFTSSLNEKYYAACRAIGNTNWKLYYVVPYNEILSPGDSIRKYIFIITLIIGLLSFSMAYYVANTTTRRIRSLANHMDKVRKGDLGVQAREFGKDEISHLTSIFNFMVREMAAMIEERFKTGKRIKALELKSLQAQINPHFLYNSLDMINCTAAINNVPEISTMVQALSKFYKIGLSKGKEVISIREELEHVKAYVTIQNLRFENSIQLEIAMEEALLQYGILKMTLQPIVENAIQHGILIKRERAGKICIRGRLLHPLPEKDQEADRIEICVQDNGVGMDMETVTNILTLKSKDEYSGYGIKNINERVILHYGSSYGLSFQSKLDAGTSVFITIPAEGL